MKIRGEKMGLDPEKLRQFLAQEYEDQKTSSTQPEAAGGPADPEPKAEQQAPSFSLKPEELISYLDQYVIQQGTAKAVLATKICTHFNRLNLPPDDEEEVIGNIKNNVLLIGPTGVGKTYLIKLIARKLRVPFVKADATKFSETGYVGGDVEDLVRELVRETDGNIDTAEHGIIYIDEIDKIAASGSNSGPDVSRSGVQRNLLKLMEETEVDLKSPHDIASQMESVMQMQRTGSLERKKVNTRNILFVVSGAFSGLKEIIGRRLNRGNVGFRSHSEGGTTTIAEQDILQHTRAEDLIEYGFESEFIGRLPVMGVLDELTIEDLLSILRNPKCNVILSKKRDFRAYGITIEFQDEALQLLARRAFEEHTGARGLVGAVEKALLVFEKKLPSVGIKKFTVTTRTIEQPDESLSQILINHSLVDFIENFLATHDIQLVFTPAASIELIKQASSQNKTPATLCNELFTDYAYGLKLLEHKEFEITDHILKKPQEYLNELIKKSYRQNPIS